MKNLSLCAVLGFSFLMACSSNHQETTETTAAIDSASMPADTATANPGGAQKPLQPAGPKPDWAPELKPEMGVVLEKLASLGGKPIEKLSAQEARQQPTPTDAVLAVMKDHQITPPAPKADTTGKNIPVAGGSIHARIYTPTSGTGPFPVIVYYHGGGWVIADLDTYHASAQGLAEQVGAVVVSVAYRQAPEHKFPTQHQDAFAAYEWVLKNAASLNADPKRIAVAGESAGGNLACNVSLMARDRKVTMPLHQLLVYPIAANDLNSESYQQYAAAKPLNKPMMEWFMQQTLPQMSQSKDPRISLVNASLKGLPPTTLIAAQLDPLLTEGKLLADKLKEAGVAVEYQRYDGVTHEFFGMAAVVPEAKEAQAFAAQQLQAALRK